ncbi:lipocalin family protein [Cochleicola gelatinilyticus]|uniref:Lipocalin-like domain-containing protein n=1 Tax=Cochleicola gelatinilyticus TaxID=1763537 RepID=A0A167JB91_9FLAO|nr:lipocalin family protein [Cochleicola gelatinilyticus]OAB80508.1 hypothetical protein ULVI_07180 [Cochleicola gelatinilyticus]
MKNFLSLLAIALVITSCSSDDDNGGETASLVGTWKMTSFGGESTIDIDMDGSASSNLLIETNCYQNETLTFADNGTGVSTSTSYAEITLDISSDAPEGGEYTIECIEEIEISPLTFTQSGNTVDIDSDGESIEAELSGNTMTIVIPSGYFVDVVEGDGSAVLIEDLTIVYQKQ